MTHQRSLSEVIEFLNNSIKTDRSKIIIFLESSENVRSYLILKNCDKTHLFMSIATTPEVCYELDKYNEKYISIDEFFTIEKISNLGYANFTKVENLCKKIDRDLCEKFSILKEFSLKPAINNVQFIKILFDVLTIKISTVDSIIKREKPSIILTFSKKTDMALSMDIPFRYDEHLFDILLNLDGWSCKHISIKNEAKSFKNGGEISSIRLHTSLIKKIKMTSPSFYSLAYVYSHFGLMKSVEYLRNIMRNVFKRKKIVCISGYGYDWNNIISDLTTDNYKVIYVDYETRILKLEKIQDSDISKDEIKNTCILCNVDFSDIFVEKLMPILENSLEVAFVYPQQIEKIFKKYQPCALLCSIKSNFINHIPARIAQTEKIPVISWQHGAAGFFYYPILWYNEIKDSDLHLVWGPGVKNQIDREFPKKKCIILPTGSNNLQKKYKKNDRKKKFKILYVTTNYFLTTLYIGYSHKLQDNSFWITQKKIIDVLGSCQQDIVFKLHPGTFQHRHFYEYIKERGFNKITIMKNERSFSSLLQNSEIIIIDYPSTTLLQAIASKKTVFVLLKHISMTDDAKKLLMKRAYCSENLEEFVDLINCYFKGIQLQQNPDRENIEFLEEYGISRRDGSVAKRVIDALNSECQKKRL